jgi:hypothetical protein
VFRKAFLWRLHDSKVGIAIAGVCVCALVLGVVAWSGLVARSGLSARQHSQSPLTSLGTPLLPGEQMWGAYPNYLFGVANPEDYIAETNLQATPAIQQHLRQAHMTLMRIFVYQRDPSSGDPWTDQQILTRVRATEAAGMTCLIELPTENPLAFDEHVVRLLGTRCNLYEFMNEPDIENVSPATYLRDWNTEIPRFRALNRQALFGGPATSWYGGWDCIPAHGDQECFMQQFLQGVARSGVLPDFITFHQYPCYEDGAQQCAARASTYKQDAQIVLGWEKQYLGKLLPTGLTEWNMDPSGPAFQLDAGVITPFVKQSLMSMQQGGLVFATYEDCCNYGGYGNFDLFDVTKGGAPNPAFESISAFIAQVYPAGG